MKRVFLYLAKMADASSAMRAKKIPDSLYELCIANVVNCLLKNKCDRNDLHSLPDHILMDVYFKVSFQTILSIKTVWRSESTVISSDISRFLLSAAVDRLGWSGVESSETMNHCRGCQPVMAWLL